MRTIFKVGLALSLASACWAWVPGFMTGGGSVFTASGVRVTHGFELHCGLDTPNGLVIPGPNNLEINWEGHQFHLDNLTFSVCSMSNPPVSPAPPDAPFNSYWGIGTGTYDGMPGVNISFVFRDYGEPGTKDTAFYTIWLPNGTPVLTVEETALTKGNQQAHAAH